MEVLRNAKSGMKGGRVGEFHNPTKQLAVTAGDLLDVDSSQSQEMRPEFFARTMVSVF